MLFSPTVEIVGRSYSKTPTRRPVLPPLQTPGSPTARRSAGIIVEEPSSPHYVPRNFAGELDASGAGPGSPFRLDDGGLSSFDALNLSPVTDGSPTTTGRQPAGASPPPLPPQRRVQDYFNLPPLLVVCLVRHITKTGEVIATPQNVEQAVRDLQTFFSSPIPVEQIHKNKNSAASSSHSAGTNAPHSQLSSTTTNVAAAHAGNTTSSSSDQFLTAYAGSRVSLQFGKAVDVYSTGGSAILNLFIYAVDESTSRPRLMAQVAKDWKEHLASSTGGGESSCMVLLYHADMVAATQSQGSVNKAKVESAAALLETYYSELRALHFGPQQMSAYHPQETPVRLLERLRTACAERTEKLRGLYEGYLKVRRSLPLDPAIAKAAPPYLPPATVAATAAPGQQSAGGANDPKPSSSPAPAGPKSSPAVATWNVQQLWRLGYDLVLHYLQFGLVRQSQAVLQTLYVEYYNNSDDYQFVSRKSTLERLGRVPNLLDPRRAGTEPGKSGYPKVLEPSAELIEGLLFLAAGDMACWALLDNLTQCKARYETVIQVTREKFAEECDDESEKDATTVTPAKETGIPRVLQQFFLLQCFLSGLRTFWPLYGLASSPAQQQQQQQPTSSSSPPATGSMHDGATPLKMLPETASPTPVKVSDRATSAASPEPILAPVELDGPRDHGFRASVSTEGSTAGVDTAELRFSMIAPPPGFLASLPSSASGSRGRKVLFPLTSTQPVEHDEGGRFTIPEALRRMLHIDDAGDEMEREAGAGGSPVVASTSTANSTEAATRCNVELVQLAFEASTDSVKEAVACLVKLAQGVGFLLPTEVPVDVLTSATGRRLRQVRTRCAHIADLAISARDCLSFIGDALGFSELSLTGSSSSSSKGALATFRGGKSEAAVGVPPTSSSSTAAALPQHFSNVEELQSPENATRFWRLLTVMASVALRVAGQRRREFNLSTRLALTYLADDPITTMRITSRRLIPFIHENGWWHLEYFARRLYVDSADHLIDHIQRAVKDWSPTHQAALWRLLFVNEATYALYKECLLFLLHKTWSDTSEPGKLNPDGEDAAESFEIGSLDNRTFAKTTTEELWRKMLYVDSLVERPVFNERLPECSLEALVDGPTVEVRTVLGTSRGEGSGGDVGGGKGSGSAAAAPLRVELDEEVLLTFTCRCPVNVVPSISGRPTTIRAVLESRRDWADPVEATHVVAMADGEIDYRAETGELVARFRFAPCHAGFYRLRSIGLCNDATRLSFYPQRFAAPSLAHDAAGEETGEALDLLPLGSPTSLTGSPKVNGQRHHHHHHQQQQQQEELELQQQSRSAYRSTLGFGNRGNFRQGHRCARLLLHVPEPASGIRLRVDAPEEEHCFADSLTYFTLHVEMEEPLRMPETSVLVPLVGADGKAGGAGATTSTSTFSDAGNAGEAAGLPAMAVSAPTPTARGVLQDKMKRSVRGDKGHTADVTIPAGPQRPQSECVFETSPGVLPTTVTLGGHAASQTRSAPLQNSFGSLYHRTTSPVTHSLLHARPPASIAGGPGNLSLSSQALLIESSWNLKADSAVVAVVQVAPPKAPRSTSPQRAPTVTAAAAAAAQLPQGKALWRSESVGTPQHPHTVRENPPHGANGAPSPTSAAAAAAPSVDAGLKGALPQFYNTDVTVEFTTDALTPTMAAAGMLRTPEVSTSFVDGQTHHQHRHRSRSHAHHKHRDANSLSNTWYSNAAAPATTDEFVAAPSTSADGAGHAAGVSRSLLLPQKLSSSQPAPEADLSLLPVMDTLSGSPPAPQPTGLDSSFIPPPAITTNSHTMPAMAASPPSVASSGALEHVRLAVHPSAHLRCAGDHFTPVGHPGAAGGTQLRVTMLEPQSFALCTATHDKTSNANGAGPRGPRQHHAPYAGETADDEAIYEAGLPTDRFGGSNSTQERRRRLRKATTVAARTVIPVDEAAVMGLLQAPQAETVPDTGATALPLQMTGAVSVYPRRECTFQLVVDDEATAGAALNKENSFPLHTGEADGVTDAETVRGGEGADAAPLALTKNMALRLPLLPLFMTCDHRPRGGVRGVGLADAGRSAEARKEGAMGETATRESASPTSNRKDGEGGEDGDTSSSSPQRSTVSFTCLRGRETCTSTAALSFPFAQAVSARFAFRHFQSRVYCLVTLTNELERTSLWVRGILLRILDLLPSYEVVRVSDSYESLLRREWKARESLSVLYELALCRRFQPTEAVLQHRVRVEVFYSDWNRTFLTTPEAQRIVLKPMCLPETEAGAESVRIDDVSLRGGSVAADECTATVAALPDMTAPPDVTDATQYQETTGLPADGSSHATVPQESTTARLPSNSTLVAAASRATLPHIDEVESGRVSRVERCHSRSPRETPHTAMGADIRGAWDNGSSSSPSSSTTSTSSGSMGKPKRKGSYDDDDDDDNAAGRSLVDVGPAVRYNPVSLSVLSATCNTYVSQEEVFSSKHLCLFSAVMYAESPWTTRFGAATNYPASPLAARLSAPPSTFSNGRGVGRTLSGSDTRAAESDMGLMGDAMVDQPADFRFIAGEPVRFCVRLEPNAHNWPEEAGVEEEFFIQLQYNPQQWMVIGKQRERRALSLMEDVTVNFTAVPLLPPTADENPSPSSAAGASEEDKKKGASDGRVASKVRFAGSSVQDEGVLDTPTIKLFWANPKKAACFAAAATSGGGDSDSEVLIDVVRFRAAVKVYKKVR